MSEKKEKRMVNLIYNPVENELAIDAKKEDFDPKYLEYMMEYAKIPKNARVRFLKDVAPESAVRTYEVTLEIVCATDSAKEVGDAVQKVFTSLLPLMECSSVEVTKK